MNTRRPSNPPFVTFDAPEVDPSESFQVGVMPSNEPRVHDPIHPRFSSPSMPAGMSRRRFMYTAAGAAVAMTGCHLGPTGVTVTDPEHLTARVKAPTASLAPGLHQLRSEERRVGKECRL